jgi:hypothetical protein
VNRREALTSLLGLPATTVITRTAIRPNDLIVITAPGPISLESARLIKEHGDGLFRELGVKCVVLSDGMTLSVVREGAKAK